MIINILLAIAFLVLILLVSPISLSARIKNNVLTFRGHYLLGLIQISFSNKALSMRIFGINIKTTQEHAINMTPDEKIDLKDDDKPDKQIKTKKKKKWQMPSKEVIYHALSAIKKVVMLIKPKKFHLIVRLGLMDPYDTGMIALIINTISYPLNKVRDYHIVIVPNYETIDLNANGHLEITFSIAQILYVALRFVFKKPVRHYLFKKS